MKVCKAPVYWNTALEEYTIIQTHTIDQYTKLEGDNNPHSVIYNLYRGSHLPAVGMKVGDAVGPEYDITQIIYSTVMRRYKPWGNMMDQLDGT